MPYVPAVDQKLGSTRTLLREHGDGEVTSVIRRTVLPGGLRVVTEAMPGTRSATLGLWAGLGSRDEAPSLGGATHFLEHLLFKGTRRRTAQQISAELDAVGGELNAFTGREYTCYHARVLDRDVPLAVDVLCDMVTSSMIPTHEVEAERGVILDEIALHDDDPDEVAHDAFVEALYAGAPLGRPITGTVGSIGALTREQIAGYYRRRYTSPTLVFSAAGNVNHAQMVRWVRRAFERSGALGRADRGPAPVRSAGRGPAVHSGQVLVERPTEQATFVWGFPGLARHDHRRHAMGVLLAVLGGGPSSRLFQEVREQRGLAYGVYAFAQQFTDAGLVAASSSCAPDKLTAVLDICRDEFAKVAAAGITLTELERGKGQLRGNLVLGLEDSYARMSRIGTAELVPGGLTPLNQSLARIAAVTLDDVHQVASQMFDGDETLAVVGPARALQRLG